VGERPPAPAGTRAETVLAWVATLGSCGYLYWAYTVLQRHTVALGSAIDAAGGDLTSPARVVLDHHAWLYPLIFGSTAILLVTKELTLANKRLTLALTFVIALVTLFVVDSVRALLFVPLLKLLESIA